MFEDVYRVSTKKVEVSADEVDALAKQLQIPLPLGYKEFITTFGNGDYCNNILVWTPNEVVEETKNARGAWGVSLEWLKLDYIGLTEEQLLESFLFAISENRDDIIFHPAFPNDLFVLARGDDVPYTMPQGFFDPLDWRGAQGEQQYQLTPSVRFFVPNIDRAVITFSLPIDNISLSDLIDLFISHWKDSPSEQFEFAEGIYYLFLQSIGAFIQIGVRDNLVEDLRIDYDVNFKEEVLDFVTAKFNPKNMWQHG